MELNVSVESHVDVYINVIIHKIKIQLYMIFSITLENNVRTDKYCMGQSFLLLITSIKKIHDAPYYFYVVFYSLQVIGELDTNHLYIGRVFGIVLLSTFMLNYLTRETLDGTVPITLMMARVFVSSTMQIYSWKVMVNLCSTHDILL